MNTNRLPDYIDHMQQAAADACIFVEGLEKADFLADKRTQQAVIMSLIVVGEAATKVMDGYPDFTLAQAQVPWRSMRGMRNRIAHGYFEVGQAAASVGVGGPSDTAVDALEHPAAGSLLHADKAHHAAGDGRNDAASARSREKGQRKSTLIEGDAKTPASKPAN